MFNKSGLYYEREYTPSFHVKRFQTHENPQIKVIENFIRIGQLSTADAFSKYKVRKNVRYGGVSDNQLLDIFYNDYEFGTPIFVYIHGGFWTELDKSSSGVCVNTFLRQEYRVLLVDYNLCPRVTLKQLCEQIKNFYQWLKEYALKTRGKEIIICGHSAGAHLACQIFQMANNFFDQQSFKINFFLISGIYDLGELWPLSCCNNNNVLSLNALVASQLSPLCWIYSESTISWFINNRVQINILAGEFDSESFKKQSQMYSELLKSLGLNVNYQILQSYDHFNIIEEMVDPNSTVCLYIKSKIDEMRSN